MDRKLGSLLIDWFHHQLPLDSWLIPKKNFWNYHPSDVREYPLYIYTYTIQKKMFDRLYFIEWLLINLNFKDFKKCHSILWDIREVFTRKMDIGWLKTQLRHGYVLQRVSCFWIIDVVFYKWMTYESPRMPFSQNVPEIQTCALLECISEKKKFKKLFFSYIEAQWKNTIKIKLRPSADCSN